MRNRKSKVAKPKPKYTAARPVLSFFSHGNEEGHRSFTGKMKARRERYSMFRDVVLEMYGELPSIWQRYDDMDGLNTGSAVAVPPLGTYARRIPEPVARTSIEAKAAIPEHTTDRTETHPMEFVAQVPVSDEETEQPEMKIVEVVSGVAVPGKAKEHTGSGPEKSNVAVSAKSNASAKSNTFCSNGKDTLLCVRHEKYALRENESKDCAELSDTSFIIDHGCSVLQFCKSDYLRLFGDSWYNDKSIDAYLTLLCRTKNGRTTAVVDTVVMKYVFAQAHEKTPDYKKTRLFVKKNTNLLRNDLVFFPVNVGGIHWSILVLDMINAELYYLDSLTSKESTTYLHDAVLQWIKACWMRKGWVPPTFHQAEVKKSHGTYLYETHMSNDRIQMRRAKVVKQIDGSACGVLVCMYARSLKSGTRMTLNARKTDVYRQEIRESLENGLVTTTN